MSFFALSCVRECRPSIVAQLFAHLTPDQIAISAEYFGDGMTREQIAAKRKITVRTVGRILIVVRSTCERLGIECPQRFKYANTRHVRNISPELMASL